MSVRVLATTSIVLWADTVKPLSVEPLALRLARKVPPLRRMFPTAAVPWPKGPAAATAFTVPTSRMPLLMVIEPVFVLLPARMTLPDPDRTKGVVPVVPLLFTIAELIVTALLELLMMTKSLKVLLMVPPAMMLPPVAPAATPMVRAPAPEEMRIPPGAVTPPPLTAPPTRRKPAVPPAVRTSSVRLVESLYFSVFVSTGAARVPDVASTTLFVVVLLM